MKSRTKTFAPLLSLLTFVTCLLASQLGLGQCTVVRVTSKDDLNHKIWGTGFAISNNRILLNDHTLGVDNGPVKVTVSAKAAPIVGAVLGRDLYTDLAVIEVPTRTLKPCALSTMKALKALDPVTVIGFEKDALTPFEIKTRVMNPASGNLQVPGVTSAIELQQDVYRHSMSGSAVMAYNSVVGIVSERTFEGTALVIPVAVIQKVITEILSGRLPHRSFSFDRPTQTFSFSGLSFSATQQGPLGIGSGSGGDDVAGDPHGKHPVINQSSEDSTDGQDMAGADPHGILLKGDPHGLRGPPNPYDVKSGTEMVATSDDSLGYVVAKIVDLNTLKIMQPEVADLAASSETSIIMIRSVDRVATPNLLELIRFLACAHSVALIASWWSHLIPKLRIINTYRLLLTSHNLRRLSRNHRSLK